MRDGLVGFRGAVCLLTSLFSAAGVLLGTTHVIAQTVPPAQDTSRSVILGGIEFIRFHTSCDGRTPEERAAEVQQRLNDALSAGPDYPSDITVGQLDGDWCVLFRGRRFYTADLVTARFNNTAPEDLANEWAAKLRFLLPDLTKETSPNTPVSTTAAPTPVPASK